MSSRTLFRFGALAVMGLLLLAWSLPDRSLNATLSYGTPALQSIGALAFGPENILFVGDAQGAAVFALDVEDEAMQAEPINIERIDEKVAALLGISTDDLQIHDIAVHPHSQRAYLSVSRGQGEEITPVLLRTTAAGDIEEVSLENVRFSQGSIRNAPGVEDQFRRGSARPYAITDLAYVDGQVYVAGLTNEEFASHFRRLAFPFTDEMTSTSLEIYHVSHNANETHAPINVFLPYELNDELHMLATYTCTPLVDFNVGVLEDGAHVKGKTVAELGAGNSSLGMLSYEKDGQDFILIANSRHPLMKIDPQAIAGAERLEMPTRETGVAYTALPHQGIQRITNLNADYVLALQRDGETSLNLVSIPVASL